MNLARVNTMIKMHGKLTQQYRTLFEVRVPDMRSAYIFKETKDAIESLAHRIIEKLEASDEQA